jgi:hypothetical protein
MSSFFETNTSSTHPKRSNALNQNIFIKKRCIHDNFLMLSRVYNRGTQHTGSRCQTWLDRTTNRACFPRSLTQLGRMTDRALSTPLNSAHGLDLERQALFNPDLTGCRADGILIHGSLRLQAIERHESYDRPKP